MKYKYDFSIIDKLEIPELYYLLDLNSPEKEILINKIKETKRDDVEIVLEAARLNPKKRLEADRNVTKRVNSFKHFLKSFVKANNIPASEEIAVVTHSEVITHALSTDFNEEGRPKFMHMENCSIFEWSNVLD